MSMDHGNRQFHYGEPCLGTVVGVYPIDATRRLYADVLPFDFRGAAFKCPVFTQAGISRNLRKGMTVMIVYVDGNPQFPLAVAHTFNNEPPRGQFGDPLPPPFTQIDDLVLYHDETKSFMRARSRQSTASQSVLPGSPAVWDITLQSGLTVELYEYNPTGYTPPPPVVTPNPIPPNYVSPPPPPDPPAPDRAKLTITMPSGLQIVADEPSTGHATLTISMPSGASVAVDVNGNVTVNSPGKALITSPNVQLGADSGQVLAYKSDVDVMKSYLDAHTHSNVQGGAGTSGPPVSPSPAPIGTMRTHAT
jgi:hypothetical protein